jgi:lysyl-tRNA synthetase, class I
VLGGRPPEGFNYEMFLDEKGEKISKSKGNGLSLEEWLRYGSEESLAFYIFREPKKAKSLHIGVIPRAVDDYWQFRGNYPQQPVEQKLGNPVHHIHAGKVPEPYTLPVTYGLLAQPRQPAGVADKETAWKFVQRHAPGNLAAKPSRARPADRAGRQLRARFRGSGPEAPGADRGGSGGASRARFKIGKFAKRCRCGSIQNLVFEIGKAHYGKEALRSWFQALYETLLGSSQGPRMGSFIALYGIDNSRRLIAEALVDA